MAVLIFDKVLAIYRILIITGSILQKNLCLSNRSDM